MSMDTRIKAVELACMTSFAPTPTALIETAASIDAYLTGANQAARDEIVFEKGMRDALESAIVNVEEMALEPDVAAGLVTMLTDMLTSIGGDDRARRP